MADRALCRRAPPLADCVVRSEVSNGKNRGGKVLRCALSSRAGERRSLSREAAEVERPDRQRREVEGVEGQNRGGKVFRCALSRRAGVRRSLRREAAEVERPARQRREVGGVKGKTEECS